MFWELGNVEEAFKSGIFVTVAFVTVNSVFVTPLVVVPNHANTMSSHQGCKQ